MTGQQALKQYRRMRRRAFYPDSLSDPDKQMINQYIAGFSEPEKNMAMMLERINKILEQNGRKIHPIRVSMYVQ